MVQSVHCSYIGPPTLPKGTDIIILKHNSMGLRLSESFQRIILSTISIPFFVLILAKNCIHCIEVEIFFATAHSKGPRNSTGGTMKPFLLYSFSPAMLYFRDLGLVYFFSLFFFTG